MQDSKQTRLRILHKDTYRPTGPVYRVSGRRINTERRPLVGGFLIIYENNESVNLLINNLIIKLNYIINIIVSVNDFKTIVRTDQLFILF